MSLPWIFANLPAGYSPLSYFDDNFNYLNTLVQNQGVVQSIIAGPGISINSADIHHPIVSNTGVLTVVAGSNITINSIDPSNPIIATVDDMILASFSIAATPATTNGLTFSHRADVTAFGVAVIQSISANTATVFDIMPKGAPGDVPNNGVAWTDVCNADLKANPAVPTTTVRFGIRLARGDVGIRVFNGGALVPLYFVMGATDTAVLNTDGTFNFGFAVSPMVNGGSSLGTNALQWANVFVTSGGAVNFAGGDALITHAANQLQFTLAANGYVFDNVIAPTTNGGAAIGTGAFAWSGLCLSSGGTLNFGNGNFVVTHSAGNLAFNGSVTVANLIGGTAVASSLTLQSTSGAGTADFINFKVGNAGAIEAARFDTAGRMLFGSTVAFTTTGGALTPNFQIHGVNGNQIAQAIFNWGNTPNGANQLYQKSRSGTVGTRGIVLVNDVIASQIYYGDDGVNFIEAARIQGVVDNTPGVGVMPGRLVFGTTPTAGGASVTRMQIDSAGFTSIVGGSFGRGAPVTKTADFTVANTENFLINNKAAATCVATLPPAASFVGRELYFNNEQAQLLNSASSNVIPKVGGAAAASILPATAGAWALLVSNGTSWKIMLSGI